MKAIFITAIIFCCFIKCNNVLAQCAVTESYTVSPQPVGNVFGTSTTVTFCYTLNGFNQNGANWLDGFIITLGDGWDSTSITPILIPNSCYGWGFWNYYDSVVSTYNGTFGPGFYYDNFDPITFASDSNPGNDFGDFTLSGTCQWDLCFSVTVNPTCSNSDLSVFITAVGDGQVGSWVSNDCPGIPFEMSNATCIAYCAGFSVTALGINPNCLANNGSVSSSINAGTMPYNYLWSNPAGTTSGMNNLAPGTYTITITDLNNCVAIDTVVLSIPPTGTISASIVDATCLSYCNGSINVSTQAGLSPFNYQWNNGLPSIPNPINLCAGTYTITVTDANMCTVSNSYSVAQPTGMNLNLNSTPTSCPGLCDGTLSAQVTQGTPPYNLVWFNNLTNDTITGLCNGFYSVTATDANGCTLLGSNPVNQPAPILINTYPHHVSCKGLTDGWVTFTQQNAMLPYSSLWLPTVWPFDTLKNVGAGNYNVILTDVQGCTGTASAIVFEPEALSLTIETTPTSCPLASDGVAIAFPVGGTSPFAFIWNNLPGIITETASNLSFGYYEVVVTDAHGCTASAAKDVLSNNLFSVFGYGDTIIVNENNALIGVNISQNGNYTYAWSPIEFNNSPNYSTTLVSPTTTTTYTILVIEDGSNCINADSVVVIILPTTYIFIPNAFSPNDDGVNDFFLLIKGDVVSIEDVKIVNRWGKLVYRNTELEWNGKNQEEIACGIGVYVYTIEYKIEGDQITYMTKGNVTLVR